ILRVGEKTRRRGAETECEETVSRDWNAAALEMSEHDGPGLFTGEPFDLRSHDGADASEARPSEGALCLGVNDGAAARAGAFRDAHDREGPAPPLPAEDL